MRGNSETVTPQEMAKTYDVNSIAPFALSKALFPLIKQSASKGVKSAVVNISSILGCIELKGPQGMDFPAYSASKAAQNMLSKILADHFRSSGIIVLPLHPGWVQTDMGGKEATLDTFTSISRMLKVINNLDMTQSGVFTDYDGNVLPW